MITNKKICVGFLYKKKQQVPLSLVVRIKCYVDRLSVWVFASDGITEDDWAVRLKQRLDVVKVSVQGNAADHDLCRRRAKRA